MRIIGEILGLPLGYVMYFCYWLLHSYGGAILLFAAITKLIFLPLSISSQKNSIRLLQLQPELNEIKLSYAGNKERINEEQYELFKREKYSPLEGIWPLLIQLVLIFGMVNVIYNPLRHLLHMDAAVIETLAALTRGILGKADLGLAEQLYVVAAVHDPANAALFLSPASGLPDPSAIVAQINALDLHFLGLNLGLTPSLTQPSALLFIPLVSGLSSLVLCLVQNALSPATQQQGFWAKWGMTIFLVAFSTYFPLVVPAGVGLYWFASNAFGILVALLLNAIYNPKKYVDFSKLEKPKKLTRLERAEIKAQTQLLQKRENDDYELFFAAKDKKLVFYSISSGQYKYFQTMIEYICSHSELPIHYVTSDPNDAIFEKNNPQLTPYYIGEKKIIRLMLKMDADMVVMTVPDLQNYHVKRSVARDDIEYVYIFHTVASMHMTLREGAVDHYDTVFCVGPHQVREIRQTEQVYGQKRKQLVKHGYGVIDMLLEAYETLPPKKDEIPQILIAPSWQVDNLLDTCIDEIIGQLDGKGYRLIVRPHPQYIKLFPERMQAILDCYKEHTGDGLVFELDFSGNDSIYQSDILLTDWSNIAFEFSYCTKKPSLFINTPMKVMNPNYENLGIEPLDITLRSKVGRAVEPDRLEQLPEIVHDMLENTAGYQKEIEETVEAYLYHPGRSGEAGGRYILGKLDR